MWSSPVSACKPLQQCSNSQPASRGFRGSGSPRRRPRGRPRPGTISGATGRRVRIVRGELRRVSMLVSVLLLGESAQAEATKHYGALSVAKWRAVDGATRVTTNASVNQPSQAAADANAIARCVADGGVNCQIVRRFGEGECGWMSLSKRGTAATYGFGPTAKAALASARIKPTANIPVLLLLAVATCLNLRSQPDRTRTSSSPRRRNKVIGAGARRVRGPRAARSPAPGARPPVRGRGLCQKTCPFACRRGVPFALAAD
jgi:hypothetical protein